MKKKSLLSLSGLLTHSQMVQLTSSSACILSYPFPPCHCTRFEQHLISSSLLFYPLFSPLWVLLSLGVGNFISFGSDILRAGTRAERLEWWPGLHAPHPRRFFCSPRIVPTEEIPTDEASSPCKEIWSKYGHVNIKSVQWKQVSEIVFSVLPCAFKEFHILKMFPCMEQRQQTCTHSIVPQFIKAETVDPKKCILLLYMVFTPAGN